MPAVADPSLPPTRTPGPAVTVKPLTATFKPDLYERTWCSVPHPTLPLLATAHAKSVTVFSLSTLTAHSSLADGHSRSVRSVSWKPRQPPGKLCLATASFDSTAGLWRWQGGPLPDFESELGLPAAASRDFTAGDKKKKGRRDSDGEEDTDSDSGDDKEWGFYVVLDGHESEIKGATFSPSGMYLATCSRDKSVWIWEDVGTSDGDDEWETVAVLNEHDGDVKAVAWCPDVPGRTNGRAKRFGADVLASASYDNTVRVWREDPDGDWVCVAVLEGHRETVWGVVWEGKPREEDRFPRLLTYSADGTVRLWTLEEEEEEDDDADGKDGELISGRGRTRIGGIPNTMRRSLRENWVCTATLPAVHTGDVYSVAWSAKSGLVASTGRDGVVAIYGETGKDLARGQPPAREQPGEGEAADGTGEEGDEQDASSGWRILAKVEASHGPYEVNHVTWCPRYDSGCENKGVEEMLVTTGDDGLIRPWQVELSKTGEGFL